MGIRDEEVVGREVKSEEGSLNRAQQYWVSGKRCGRQSAYRAAMERAEREEREREALKSEEIEEL